MMQPLNTLERPKARIALWDNVKFIVITFMVIGHFADVFSKTSNTCKSIYLFIYAFHMPLFIFISGLFYSENDSKQKIVYYASCGFALKIALSCVSFITGRPTHFSLLSDPGLPWIMFSLAAFQATMHLFKEINKKYLLIFSVILACFVGYDQSIGDWLYLSRIIVFSHSSCLEQWFLSKRWLISSKIISGSCYPFQYLYLHCGLIFASLS